ERKINTEHAAIIHRIFQEYDAGKSPRAIAISLNKDGIAAPRGGKWNPSTIHGRIERGYGILCNPLYSGRIVWNRVREDKEPDTLRRIPRVNDKEDWIEKDAPELRIIDEALWQRVQARLKSLKQERSEIWKANRPKHLLSGLLVCGECGHGFSKRTPDRYGCTCRRDKGDCSNQLRIRQDELEGAVLATLERYFMHPEMLQACCEAYTKRTNELRRDASDSVASIKTKIARLERERKRCIEAIKGGVPGEEVKDEMIRIRDERQQLEAQLSDTKDDPVRLHPKMADHYRNRISDLIEAIHRESRRDEAREILRGLIEKVVLTPDKDRKKLVVDLYGDLAGIIAAAEESQPQPVQAKRRVGERVVAMVGPEGLEPPT
ncbi:MAG: recombinase family protein, partial [Parvularculaceae bacterium]